MNLEESPIIITASALNGAGFRVVQTSSDKSLSSASATRSDSAVSVYSAEAVVISTGWLYVLYNLTFLVTCDTIYLYKVDFVPNSVFTIDWRTYKSQIR